MIPNINANKIISDVTGSIDKATANQQSERLKIDTTSPFKLPHLIRPISFIWAMVNETILTTSTILAVFILDTSNVNAVNALIAALAANSAILTTIIGFYFNSRRNEKISMNNSRAAIKIKRLETKAEIRREERAAKKAERNRSYTN